MKPLLLIVILLILGYKLKAQTDTTKIFYESGNLKLLFFNIEKEIHSQAFFPSGKLKAKAILGKDSSIISATMFNENAEIISHTDKKKMTIYDREFDGVMEFRMKNGEMNGIATTTQKGKLSYKMWYKNNLANGKAFGYDLETGNIVAKEHYKNGKLEGECYYFNIDGALEFKMFYITGCAIKAQTFNRKGELQYETVDPYEIKAKFGSRKDCN